MILRFSDVSTSPKTTYVYLWRPQGTWMEVQEKASHGNDEMLEILDFVNFGKCGGRHIPTIRLICS